MDSVVAIVNAALALLTIGFGAIALISPNYALGVFSLRQEGGSAAGLSEMRAASGGAFVATGAAALILGPSFPAAYWLLGAHYAGAGAGRLASIFIDGSGTRKIWAFFAIEAGFAAWLVGANLP